MSIQIFPLGAGQDVGRSCIILKIFDKKIMLDCGLHMGMPDIRKFPDFELLKKENLEVDLVLISHFHLDHCGALPSFSELTDYSGPILMTQPTKCLFPYMCEDFIRVIGNNPNLTIYSSDNITSCLSKVQTIELHETKILEGVKIKCYYAGHVLGACMFSIEYEGKIVVYTGDFNSSSDRHLGAAWIEKIKPDLLITESTYATTVRESKRTREKEFLSIIQSTVDNGGKVLIPVFAVGRAQELCILLETYWARKGNKQGVYFSGGLIDKANFFYKIFLEWTNENIKSNFLSENLFDFKHIQPFEKSLVKSTNSMVLFATPGMLHGGFSLQVFKEWCQDPKNTIIIPGYCVAGTVGNLLLKGNKKFVLDGTELEVKMKVKSLSFSAHADAKGILNLIENVEPKAVMLVHGEKSKMVEFSKLVEEKFNIRCFYPANFERIILETNKVEIVSDKDKFPNNKIIKGFSLEDYSARNVKFFTDEKLLFQDLENTYNLLESEFKLKPLIVKCGKIFKLKDSILKMYSEENGSINETKLIKDLRDFFNLKIQELFKDFDVSCIKMQTINENLLIAFDDEIKNEVKEKIFEVLKNL